MQVNASPQPVPTHPNRFDSRHPLCPGPRSRRSGDIKAAMPLATGGTFGCLHVELGSMACGQLMFAAEPEHACGS